MKSGTVVSRAKEFFVVRVIPLAVMVASAVFAFGGIRDLIRANASTEWPSTQGKVEKSSVERLEHSSTKGSRGYTYRAALTYAFAVEGRPFTGQRVAYGDFDSRDESQARLIVKRYPKGSSVTVRYREDDPQECLLEPGVTAKAWFPPGMGLFFFAFGGVLAVLFPKLYRHSTQ